ncbi:MAG: hypothetical protein RL339_987 [Pseudomonadota bacterium]|jgi:uncharacterized SAM-binding protein YcdF (DUF218 family)
MGRMFSRLFGFILLTWSLGFVLFAVTLPQPAGEERADAVVVLTGGSGRIERGLEALKRGWSRRLLVSGVDRSVKPYEFAVEYRVRPARMACCVTLGYQAIDTQSNALETAEWLRRERVKSVRLVTNDWHMRRARLELDRTAPPGVTIIADAVPTRPSFSTLLREYNKLLARSMAGALRAG